jgi:CD109 antigen
VKVTTPDYIKLKEEKLVATINAKYTYGKPIKGNAKATVYKLSWLGDRKPGLALLTKTVPIDGQQVVEFDMKKELLLIKEVKTFLQIDVSVEEELTGRKLEASTTTTVGNKVHHIEFLDAEKFKPGLPYTVVMQVECQNGDPLENAEDFLTVEYIFDQIKVAPISYQIGKLGLVTAIVNVPEAAQELKIQAKYLEAQISENVEKEYSKSGHYIRAQVLSNRIAKGKTVTVLVQGTEPMREISYFVIGRGTLLLSGQFRWKGKEYKTTFEFLANFQMVPTTTLLVYYIRRDGVIVSDRLKLTIEDDLSSEISLELAPGKAQPGEEVKLTVKAAPKSYVALLGVDQSVLVLKDDNDLTQDKVISNLKEYDLHALYGVFGFYNFFGESIFDHKTGCIRVRAPFLDDFAVSLILDAGLFLLRSPKEIFTVNFEFLVEVNCQNCLRASKQKKKPALLGQYRKIGYNIRFLQNCGLVLMTNATKNAPDPPIQLVPRMNFRAGGGPPIIIRKEFPETWLWEDFPDNE